MPSLGLITPKLLLPTFLLPNALPGTAQWVSSFPVDTNGQTNLTLMQFMATAADAITIHLVPPGATPTATNRIWNALPILAGECMEWYADGERQYTIPAAYSLFFFAGVASNVNCTVFAHHSS
jgi:hypothetical protein